MEANNEDPKAVLDGVAVAGLVGILRQLGDLVEYGFFLCFANLFIYYICCLGGCELGIFLQMFLFLGSSYVSYCIMG